MNIHQLYPGAIVKTARSYEIEQLTEQGWEVIDIREEMSQEPGFSYGEDAVNPNYQNYGSLTVRLNKDSPSRVTSHLVFILIKSKDTVIEESRKIAENYKQKAIEMLAKLEKAEEEAESWKADLERMRTSKGYEESARIAAENRLKACEQGKRTLEEHIAKLRQEIGAARFREIIGEEKKPEASS